MDSICYDLLLNMKLITQNVIDNNIKNALKHVIHILIQEDQRVTNVTLPISKTADPHLEKKWESNIVST